MIFIEPHIDYIDSFVEALEEGNFTHMALGGFGDSTPEEIKNNPYKYIQRLTDKSPRHIIAPNQEKFTFHDHNILWAVDPKNHRFLAGISLRFDDNDLINTYCGHAGMSVRKGLQYKGYGARAAIQLSDMVKDEARKRKLTKLSASASPNNPASYKIIEYMGGKLISTNDPYGWGPARFYELAL